MSDSDSLRQRLLTLLAEQGFLQRRKKQKVKEARGSNTEPGDARSANSCFQLSQLNITSNSLYDCSSQALITSIIINQGPDTILTHLSVPHSVGKEIEALKAYLKLKWQAEPGF